MINMSLPECHIMLANSVVGRLGLVGPDGRPYTIPLRYVWHEGAVYLRISHDGRKEDAIAFGRRVCFETDIVRSDFSHYASVILEGVIEDIEEDAEKRSALVALNGKYARIAGLPTTDCNPATRGVAIRRIRPEKLTGRKCDQDCAPIIPPKQKVLSRK
jgi:nitroimidazol reductase NimA-like FMN-containing flavoprotein (pyridoxamine 5'-phosphate oxidase superfamily)